MSDEKAIQGLWRVVKRTLRGKAVHHGVSHYLFEKGVFKEIVPDLVDDGTLRATYRLEPRKRPKRITITLDWNGPDGPPDPNAFTERGFYFLEGDALRICMGNDQDFPAAFSEKAGQTTTLTRHEGPPPRTKQPSGKEPIDDPVLGRLTWDDNVDWWSAEVRVGRGHPVDFSLSDAGEGKRLAKSLRQAGEFLNWLRAHEREARDFAAEELLDLHNGTWNNGRPIGKGTFVKRMKLESVGWSPEGVTLYYADGDLFWGHTITVSLGKRRTFQDAGIAG